MIIKKFEFKNCGKLFFEYLFSLGNLFFTGEFEKYKNFKIYNGLRFIFPLSNLKTI